MDTGRSWPLWQLDFQWQGPAGFGADGAEVVCRPSLVASHHAAPRSTSWSIAAAAATANRERPVAAEAAGFPCTVTQALGTSFDSGSFRAT